MMGGIPPMSIDPQTGIISAQPPNLGVYVFAVRVQEYRNGVKIGEVRRDIQYQVVNCLVTSPPVFASPVVTTGAEPSATTSYTLIAGDTLSFDVNVTSSNQNDSIFLYGSSDLLATQVAGMNASFRNDSGAGTVEQNFYLRTTCDAILNSPYHMKFRSLKNTCYGQMTTTLDVDIYVRSPLDGMIDSIIPNVFTPNGDGKNDFFHIKAVPNDCFDTFRMKIFNRWGTLVYETDDFLFQWDGKNKSGNDLPAGVYYYILDATFLQSTFNKKGVIHLRM
jgi:gliding motility-associated-like protein